ncbi:family 2 glycosyl transferase [Flavivirga aquatica]|uniref:Family 2 glycosyl transferase n=1 Tax=Flavivirga aquatica TaxID=1849968 RepID=A0A1E5TBW6_9FLAO|nr:family 2 glycosyl transferase [Flavivirga aquatica]OEK08850.1 family 2 glycosyl transferase [Flavivirga aquatica]
MQISFLIVTKHRPQDLAFTLHKLKELIDLSIHEVLVFIDGCSKTEDITSDFDWVKWTISKESVSASPARQILYKKATGAIFIGLDDDAHPLSANFILEVEKTFNSKSNIGIIAFQEVRGLFKSDSEALKQIKHRESHLTNDFVGCGFAIKKRIYDTTNGFPIWMNIYGEEPALAIEVLDLGYDILYQPKIKVNHRVDVKKRKHQGRNYYRFQHQLRNTIRFYLVYYPKPILKVLKALWHNFMKYALKDSRYFKSFAIVFFQTLFKLPQILKYRKPVKKATIQKKLSLKSLNYSN